MHHHEHERHHDHGCSYHTCAASHEKTIPAQDYGNHATHPNRHPEESDPDDNPHCSCGHDHHQHDDCGCGCGCGHDHEHGEEISKSLLIRFVVSCVLLLVGSLAPTIGLFFFIVAYLVAGYDVLLAAVKGLGQKKPFNENFLMSVATVGAFCIGEYTEAVAVMLFYQLGEIFQSYAVSRSRKSIRSLMDIRPDTATVVKNGSTITISAESVEIGDILIIKPGERVPLDGVLTEGTLLLDTSALTGESLPRLVDTGEDILSGAIVLEQPGTIRVTKRYENSTVAKILALVEHASEHKSESERFITRFSAIYTPIVIALAVLIIVLPTLFTGFDSFSMWLYRGLTFLVISCPCALVLSIPLTFFAGIGGASRHGILIKGANYLELLAKTEVFVLDKTGTLTTGKFRIQTIHTNCCDEATLLTLAASAQTHSNHPLAFPIRQAATDQALSVTVPNTSREIPGSGMETVIGSDTVLCGNLRLMEFHNIAVPVPDNAETILYLAKNGTYMGYLGLMDTEKADAADAIAALKADGVTKTVMLSGDKTNVAAVIGNRVHIDEVRGELLPSDKADVFTVLTEHTVAAYVGDGINDAPVLTMADVGIAMGELGSDIAIESADIVLTNDSLTTLVHARRHAVRVMGIVRQNVWLIFLIKLAILTLGALGYAGMWAAVIADVGTALLAILNAMRALKMDVQ